MVDDAAARPRLHARARRGPARDPRLDLAGGRGASTACASSSSTPARAASSWPARRRRRDARGARARRAARAGRPGRAARGARRRARRRRRRRPPDRPRRRALPRRRCGSTPSVEARAARADRARAAAPAEVARGARRGVGARCPDVPAVACFDTAFHATLPPRPRDLRAAARSGASAGRSAATASTGSRTPGSRGARPSCSASTAAGAADRQLPPRRRRVAVRDRRRPLGRHDDGVHAARGARDGDPLGQRRPRAAAVAARAHGDSPSAELADALEHESGLLGLAGTADMREVLARAGAGDARRAARARRLRRTGCAPGSRRWPPRSAGSTRSCSPAASASARPRSARGPATGLAFLGVAIDAAAQRRGDPATARSRPRGAARQDARDPRARGPRDRQAGQSAARLRRQLIRVLSRAPPTGCGNACP